MTREIEAKLRVDSHETVRDALRSAGAEFLGRFDECNLIYDTQDDSLRRSDRGLRLRRTTRLDAAGVHTTLTAKGPVGPGALKSREEAELQIADPAAAVQLLGLLGYACTMRFEKRRESWRLDGCAVELDALPLIGVFVEIEGPDEAAVLALQSKLGLDLVPHESRTYLALLDEACRARGVDRLHIDWAANA